MRLLLIVVFILALTIGCGGAQGAADSTSTFGEIQDPVTSIPLVTGSDDSVHSNTPTPVLPTLQPPPTTVVTLSMTELPRLEAAGSFVTVTVESGDTLLGLALEHGVPMAAIQLQNELGSSTVVRLGQQLVIPPKSAWQGALPFWIVHIVSQGETLSEIAQIYGLALSDVQGANGLTDADLLGVGQALLLPLTDFTEVRSATPPTAMPAAAAPVIVTPTAGTEADPTAVSPTAIAATPVPTSGDAAEWGRETVRILNEVRAAHSLPPLAYNETLAQAGQIQANDCAARGWCGHTGSDGSTIRERILRVGYQPASWAECWALRPDPQGAIDIWMDEVPPNDPHRRTLLTTWLTEVGIGVAKGEWGYHYFIAEFGKPLP